MRGVTCTTKKCLRQIGGNVKYLRSACHITQQELAARIGISQTHLCNLEHDHARISMKLLLRIANTLGCALEVLLDTKTAVAWGENRDGPELEMPEEEDDEASYSLEEVRLLLQILQPRKSASGLKR